MKRLNKVTRTGPAAIKKTGRTIANQLRTGARHLFLLSPPLSGSTAITQLIKTSPDVSVFPGKGEGQHLPEARNILFGDERWNPDLPIDWVKVRNYLANKQELTKEEEKPFKDIKKAKVIKQ